MLSLQVLQEFFVNITKKVSKPLEIRMAKEIVQDLLKWDIVMIDGESVLEGIDIHSRYQFSFWDSLIVHAALKGGASVLLSEDFEDGRIIEGLKIKNPFAPEKG
jgi:predicted nucleic acid-binding protein